MEGWKIIALIPMHQKFISQITEMIFNLFCVYFTVCAEVELIHSSSCILGAPVIPLDGFSVLFFVLESGESAI